jgi:hypothetical protein
MTRVSPCDIQTEPDAPGQLAERLFADRISDRGLRFITGLIEFPTNLLYMPSMLCRLRNSRGGPKKVPPFRRPLMEKEWEMANPLTVIKSLGSGKSEVKGVVKRDWVPTGRIDFATNFDTNDDPNQPSEFKLLVEERRIIESVAGNEHLEIQWRPATLKEVKVVAAQYLKYLTENSLIKSVSDPEILPPEPKHKSA